jgi:ankyrin repeat protein
MCSLLFFSLNNEDLTPLDIAIMSNHVPMAKMLIAHGGRENPKCEYINFVFVKAVGSTLGPADSPWRKTGFWSLNALVNAERNHSLSQ